MEINTASTTAPTSTTEPILAPKVVAPMQGVQRFNDITLIARKLVDGKTAELLRDLGHRVAKPKRVIAEALRNDALLDILAERTGGIVPGIEAAGPAPRRQGLRRVNSDGTMVPVSKDNWPSNPKERGFEWAGETEHYPYPVSVSFCYIEAWSRRRRTHSGDTTLIGDMGKGFQVDAMGWDSLEPSKWIAYETVVRTPISDLGRK